ncbi:MAG: UDP-N-acetylmuramoyl-L-alanine--D-glutamate ligase [Patescibacteria group bacterium]
MTNPYINKKIAVLGFGMEGQAVARFLLAEATSIEIIDQKSSEAVLAELLGDARMEAVKVLDNPKVKYIAAEKLPLLTEYDAVFRSPSVYFDDKMISEARQAGVEVSSQIQLFFDLCPCKIIGVTGTKGKGTTSSLIFSILEAQVKSQKSKVESKVYLAGNIGAPTLDLLPNLASDDIVILELSNFQLADLHSSPHIAVMTNLEIDHLDYHKDEAEYRRAKESILRYQSESDFAVLNKESTFAPDFLKSVKSQLRYFSSKDSSASASVSSGSAYLASESGKKEICTTSQIKLVGRHNLMNIAAATIVADLLGVKFDLIREAIKNFEGLPHRLETVAEIQGIKFINDSFSTNPGPTIAAVSAFDEPKVLILGGSEKGADFLEMARVIAKSNTKAVISIGVEGPRINQALEKMGFAGKIIKGEETLDLIVRQAKESAGIGDLVIFSPACASFDMFKNYKDRGEKFKEEVWKLIGKS